MTNVTTCVTIEEVNKISNGVDKVMNQMFKPMLAGKIDAPFIVSPKRFPLLVSPKLDGLRATVQNGVVYSRSLKPNTTLLVQQLLGHQELEGLDGELIVGDPTAKDCFHKSSSSIDSPDGFVFYVFDCYDPKLPFAARLAKATAMVEAFGQPYVQMVPHSLIEDLATLHRIESLAVEVGYEGVMVRDPKGPYKQGRSTLNEGYLLKMKRFVDGEGLILELIEGETNLNPSYMNELGKTARSTSKDGKVKNGTLGAFRVKNLETGVEHRVSGGCGTAEETAAIWANKEQYVGKILKFKYQACGTKDKPRFPQMVGFRDASDMDAKEGK